MLILTSSTLKTCRKLALHTQKHAVCSRSVAQDHMSAAAGWKSRCVDRDVDATLSPKSSNKTSVRTTAFASVTLRNDREVVLAAAVENGRALEFAGLGILHCCTHAGQL